MNADRNFAEFQAAFQALLEKHGMDVFSLSVIYFDEDGSARTGQLANVQPHPDRGVSQPRMGAILAEQMAGGMLDLLAKYNGLDLPAAAGSAKGMIEAKAHEISLERMHRRAQQASRAADA
jgi:hypothetical protein